MRRPSPRQFGLLLMIFAAIIGTPLLLHGISMAGEENTEMGDRSSRSLVKKSASSRATSNDPKVAIESKLKQILENQRDILQKSETVKQELQIIQVRATGRSSCPPCPACP